ncbi:hypothetical protein LTR54_017940, partial [Friedmanniomyces endolithicus]
MSALEVQSEVFVPRKAFPVPPEILDEIFRYLLLPQYQKRSSLRPYKFYPEALWISQSIRQSALKFLDERNRFVLVRYVASTTLEQHESLAELVELLPIIPLCVARRYSLEILFLDGSAGQPRAFIGLVQDLPSIVAVLQAILFECPGQAIHVYSEQQVLQLWTRETASHNPSLVTYYPASWTDASRQDCSRLFNDLVGEAMTFWEGDADGFQLQRFLDPVVVSPWVVIWSRLQNVIALKEIADAHLVEGRLSVAWAWYTRLGRLIGKRLGTMIPTHIHQMMYDLHYSYLVMGLLYRNWSAFERELLAEPYSMPRQSELAQEHLAIIARANSAGPHSSKWTNGEVARQLETTLNALVEEQVPNFEGLSARVKYDYDVVMRFGRPDEASRHT